MGGGGSGDHMSKSVWDRMKANMEIGGEAGVGLLGKTGREGEGRPRGGKGEREEEEEGVEKNTEERSSK